MPKGRQRFVLKAKPQLSSLAREPLLLIGEQIFWIGILLIEVAIGQSILDLRQDRTGGLELKTASIRHGFTDEWYPTSEILRQVQSTSTKKYGETVDFCLRKRSGAPHWRQPRASEPAMEISSAQNALMKVYYNEVYQP